MKKIAILGSTGSIGTQALEVIKANPEKFKVIALAGGKNINLLREQIKIFSPEIVSVYSKDMMETLKSEFSSNIKFVCGEEGLIEIATYYKVDFVITAVVGSVGLKPTLKAIEAGKQIGLANKETLVSAGHIVMETAIKYNVTILPIDSEHSAIFQSLNGENTNEVNKIILTASGGSFRDKTREELKNVTIKQALQHPNWSMGAKITIDSATMMNKGLEVIEAHWLFNMSFDKIEVIIHPESIIHSMVEFKDKAIIAQLGTPDMKVPIQYAMSYPRRFELNSKALRLEEIGSLNFYKVDIQRFPSLKLAYYCGREGGTLPTVLNAANEIAVEAFLNSRISFLEIEEIIISTIDKHINVTNPSLDEIFITDKWARETANNIIINKGW